MFGQFLNFRYLPCYSNRTGLNSFCLVLSTSLRQHYLRQHYHIFSSQFLNPSLWCLRLFGPWSGTKWETTELPAARWWTSTSARASRCRSTWSPCCGTTEKSWPRKPRWEPWRPRWRSWTMTPKRWGAGKVRYLPWFIMFLFEVTLIFILPYLSLLFLTSLIRCLNNYIESKCCIGLFALTLERNAGVGSLHDSINVVVSSVRSLCVRSRSSSWS